MSCSGNSYDDAQAGEGWHPDIAEAMVLWSGYYSDEDNSQDRRADDQWSLSGGWSIRDLGPISDLETGVVPWL